MRHFRDIQPELKTRYDVIAWRKKLLEDGLAKRNWNTYSSHLRTVVQFGIENRYLDLRSNPFKRTGVIPPKKRKKTVSHSAIQMARDWLELLEIDERNQKKRARITPAWFWRTVFETFHLTGIRLNALLSIRVQDVDLEERWILLRGETEKTHRDQIVPVPEPLYYLLAQLMHCASSIGFEPADQLFNVNRFRPTTGAWRWTSIKWKPCTRS